MRHCVAKEARGSERATLLVIAALFACGLGSGLVVSSSRADPRFGDSTWVAPAIAFDSPSTADGPRVAAPDHERLWETALRVPFRVAFFPLRLVASGLEAGIGYVGPRYFDPKAARPRANGPRLAPGVSFGSVNDIGVGPVVTWGDFPLPGARFRLSGTWSAIDHRRAHFSETVGLQRPVGFRLRGDYDDQPNRRFYGIGNESPQTLSYFRLASTGADAALLLGASPQRQVRVEGGYSSMSPRRGSHATPLLENVFPAGDAPFEHQATQELWYGMSADLAALDDGRDPSRGVHGRLELRRAAGVGSDDPDYSQWRFEGRAYVPVFAKRRVVAVRAVYAGVDPQGGTTTLPFYRLAQSEGTTRFAGYGAGRFRDRQLVLTRIEYRWAVLYRMSALGLYELGAVAPGPGSFTLSRLHASYGGGLRLAMTNVSTLRVELAKSVEGLHAVLALGGDF